MQLKDTTPVLRITYVTGMWDDAKIWTELFNAPKWTIKYTDGSTKEEEPKLKFKTKGVQFRNLPELRPSNRYGRESLRRLSRLKIEKTDEKILIYALLALLAPASAMADEGMWLVNLFESSIYPQMKKKGLKLKPGEIYNERGYRTQRRDRSGGLRDGNRKRDFRPGPGHHEPPRSLRRHTRSEHPGKQLP